MHYATDTSLCTGEGDKGELRYQVYIELHVNY